MTKIIKCFLGVFVLFFSTISVASETVRLTTGEWSPFISKELNHFGVVAHIVTEAFALEGVKVEYGFFPWGRAKDLAKEGDWQGSMVWAYSSDRAKDFLFSDPVVVGKDVFFHLQSYSFDWKVIDDLKGIEIGGTIEYDYGKAFQEAEKMGTLLIERVPTDEINFRKLLIGRIQLFPVNLDVGYDILQKKFKPEEIQRITYHSKTLGTSPNSIIFSKKIKRNQFLLNLFNKGLKRLKASGKYDQYFEESRQGKYLIKR